LQTFLFQKCHYSNADTGSLLFPDVINWLAGLNFSGLHILETMLHISPSLAQTLGLEEALLVQLFLDMQSVQLAEVITFQETHRQQFLPFWSATQFRSVLQRLQAQGVASVQGEQPWQIRLDLPGMTTAQITVSQPYEAPKSYAPPPPEAEPVPVYTMNDARRRNQSDDDLAYLKPKVAKASPRAQKTTMHAAWEPSEDFPNLLSFHNIPLQFALSELAKFRQYYSSTDRMEISWDVRYLNWVQRAWHDSLNSKGRHDRQQTNTGESADTARGARSKVRDALRNIQDTDW
jgi:hypothetical protein